MARLGGDEIEDRLSRLEGWSLEDGALAREQKCDKFTGSVEFVTQVAGVAEEMNHHPDLAISWDTVSITITTHSEGGLTASDFELAERIDRLG